MLTQAEVVKATSNGCGPTIFPSILREIINKVTPYLNLAVMIMIYVMTVKKAKTNTTIIFHIKNATLFLKIV